VHDFAIHPDRPGNDPIFALNAEAAARAAQGETIVNATIGELRNDDGTLAIIPTASHTVAEVGPNQWAPYAPISGEPMFLGAVMDDLLGPFPALSLRAVAVATPGGSGAIRHAVCTFLEQGQSLLTTSFFWAPYGIIADEHGRNVATFEMFDAEGRIDAASLDRALGEHLASQRRALLVFNDPCHNPTGYSMSDADWNAVVSVIGRHAASGPVAVLIDCAYAAYGRDGVEPAVRALETIGDRILLLLAWSASKTFTHYGLRVGALVAIAPDDAQKKSVQAALGYGCRATWSNCNRGGMLAMSRLLREPLLVEKIRVERKAVVELLGRRVALFNRLAQSKGLKYPRYDGGFFVTVFAADGNVVANRMKERGVFVVPVGGAVRIALCAVAEKDVARIVDAVASALQG
jgi:aromatic-amino-acid transaminase